MRAHARLSHCAYTREGRDTLVSKGFERARSRASIGTVRTTPIQRPPWGYGLPRNHPEMLPEIPGAMVGGMWNHLPDEGEGFEVLRRRGLPKSREGFYRELRDLGASEEVVEAIRESDERHRARFVVEARAGLGDWTAE